MQWLNYNQFYYFWIIARELSVTRAAQRLRVSQSNLSEQLKQLESQFGTPLFERKGRSLRLTEEGRLALDYANNIFSSGEEMLGVFRGRPARGSQEILRIGAISSLSKNLQYELTRSMLKDSEVKLVMVEGELNHLVRQLQNHSLDLVISNVPARTDVTPEVFNHRLGEIRVSLVGRPKHKGVARGFPKSLERVQLFLPTRAGRFRDDFDAWVERERLSIRVKAEIEDMALLRLFAMSGEGLALVPEIVVQRELHSGELVIVRSLHELSETFFAVTTSRRFRNARIEKLVSDFVHR
ncbi:LysR family transcriptional regulator [bacterium]|nr:LysR family transcriptional regulator [bacterium]